MHLLATNFIENAFSPLITLFEAIMVFIHAHLVGGSWGLAIVGLTVVIRAVLVPLTFRQLKAMQEMQRHVPEMQALKEKYKDDKQRQQQELMNFYRENKINPLASCLPLLLQLPVFVSLFYMLRSDLKKHICGSQLVTHFNAAKHLVGTHAITAVSHLPGKYIEKTSCNSVAPHSAKFLFLPDITNKATGVALVVLLVLYVGSQVFSTVVATATADPNQRRMMLLLPFVFVALIFKFPAGLLVYWITTNLWTIGQQLVIRRLMPPPPKPPAKGDKPGRGGSPNGKPDLPVDGAAKGEPALAGVGGTGARSSTAPPPRPPRKKKKRSGRRR
ncbi:MAG TPA: YidC/Oxa1 family membrane protein insertase [Solirubrobacteraceae bacterium]|nr:YidC/Oxa1 family membrane protein insertase [Solirubrobacteraceae bacterium]